MSSCELKLDLNLNGTDLQLVSEVEGQGSGSVVADLSPLVDVLQGCVRNGGTISYTEILKDDAAANVIDDSITRYCVTDGPTLMLGSWETVKGVCGDWLWLQK